MLILSMKFNILALTSYFFFFRKFFIINVYSKESIYFLSFNISDIIINYYNSLCELIPKYLITNNYSTYAAILV